MDRLKKKVEKYWDWRSSSYTLDIDKSPETDRAWYNTIRALADAGETRTALDVGTGPGQLAFYLAEAGFNVTGMDISPEMIRSAQKTADEMQLTINFRTGDAELLNFTDNSFDVIVSRNLIWTLPNPEKALKEWHRVLKPGGRIIVSDGFWQNQTWRRIYEIPINLLKGIFQLNNRVSLRFFLHYFSVMKDLPLYEGVKKEEMLHLLRDAGFNDASSWDVGQWFTSNPYAFALSTNPSFFVVYADK